MTDETHGLDLQQAGEALAQVTGNARRARAPLAAAGKTCGARTAAGGSCPVTPLTGHPSGRCRIHASMADPAGVPAAHAGGSIHEEDTPA